MMNLNTMQTYQLVKKKCEGYSVPDLLTNNVLNSALVYDPVYDYESSQKDQI